MDIIFTQHAHARMADPHRGVVTEEEVRSVLASPTVSYVGIDGKQNVLGEVNGKHIRICFVEEKDRLLIITGRLYLLGEGWSWNNASNVPLTHASRKCNR